MILNWILETPIISCLRNQLCCTYEFYTLSRSLEQNSLSVYRLYSLSRPQLFGKIMAIRSVWLRWIANSTMNWFKNNHWEVIWEIYVLLVFWNFQSKNWISGKNSWNKWVLELFEEIFRMLFHGLLQNAKLCRTENLYFEDLSKWMRSK